MLPLPGLIHVHPFPTLSYDRRKRRIAAANKAAVRCFGYSARKWADMPLDDFLEIHCQDRTAKSFTGTARTKHGAIMPVKGLYSSVTSRGKRFNLIIFQPADDNWATASELAARNTRLDKIVRVSHNEIYVARDGSLRFEFANNAALRNLGYTAGEITRLRLPDLFNFPDAMALQALLNSLRASDTDRLKLKLKFIRRDGTQYDADVMIQVLEQGQYFLLVVDDISEKLMAERKMMDSVMEKETLIKEMHHRVKNNLQLISSIIYLKLATISQPDIRSFLEDTRQKIRSIALIHERLLQTEKLDKVEISDYLGKLVRDLQLSYVREDLSLVINTSIAQGMIDFDTAIISGLIVNELVTNAMKHAFQGRPRGAIDIHFSHDRASGRYDLSVADDGVSLPGHVSPGKTASFGMQLVDVFVKQLDGRLEIIREKGTKFQIHF